MSSRITELDPATGRRRSVVARQRAITFAAVLGLIMAFAVPAFAHHYRDASDTSSYWSVYTTGGATMQYHSTGGRVCTNCYRQLKQSQRSSTTYAPGSKYARGTWTYTTSATAGELQAFMTCSGKMTTWDANYYVAGGATMINQNNYCNSWVSVLSSSYIDRNVYLDGISYNGSENRKVGWDGIRVFW
ncbi:MAG: hypothetical protein GY926_03100 [bacterium]|nr:hypothetical protein [bacterium]